MRRTLTRTIRDAHRAESAGRTGDSLGSLARAAQRHLRLQLRLAGRSYEWPADSPRTDAMLATALALATVAGRLRESKARPGLAAMDRRSRRAHVRS